MEKYSDRDGEGAALLKKLSFSQICARMNELEEQIAELQKKSRAADERIEDFVLESDHAPFCRYDFANDNTCSCMDRGYFNHGDNLKRARIFQKDYPKTE